MGNAAINNGKCSDKSGEGIIKECDFFKLLQTPLPVRNLSAPIKFKTTTLSSFTTFLA
jgi:hypothetical protein